MTAALQPRRREGFMAVKLELYRVFKEVAEAGNISAAAKNLYISSRP
jgi:molybdenum-dependent DNA-binding transcriptional regulator ModE